MKTPQKWLMAGLVVGVLGVVLAVAGLLIPGVLLAVVGIAILGLLGVGYPSPRAVKAGGRTLYRQDDPFGEPEQPEDPNERFVSVALARGNDDDDRPAGGE